MKRQLSALFIVMIIVASSCAVLAAATTTPVAAATVTTTTLAASTTTSAINQPITLTATLKAGTTPLSGKSVTIYHTKDGVRYTDGTRTTDSNGRAAGIVTAGSAGTRIYYATFAGDTTYQGSTSPGVTITTSAKYYTTTALSASTTTPAVDQSVTLTTTLKTGSSPVVGRSVTIYHTKDGVRYTDTTVTTNSNGQVSVPITMPSAATRIFYATVAGDTTYQGSTSPGVTVTTKLKTTLTPGGAVTFSGPIGKPITLYGQLWDQNGNAISGAKIMWYHWNVLAQKWLADVSPSYTDAHGEYHKDYLSNTAGVGQYKVSYAGDGTHFGTTCAGSFTVYYQATSSLTIANSNWNHFSGKLTADGQDVNGATVTLWRYNSDHRGLVNVGTATTDSTGAYSLDDTTLRYHGYYWYYASYDGSNIYTKTKSPEIEVQI